MTHEIKILDVFADDVLSGDKTFEIRRNDRGYKKGDHIKFNVVFKDDKHFIHEIPHKLNRAEYEITYVLSGWGLMAEYVALGIKRIDKGDINT